MRAVRLTRAEREIEGALMKGEYIDVDKKEFNAYQTLISEFVHRLAISAKR